MMNEDFKKRFDKNQSEIDFTWKIMKIFTILVIVGMIVYWGFLGFIAFKAVDALSGSDPKEVVKGLGELVKAFNEGTGKQ